MKTILLLSVISVTAWSAEFSKQVWSKGFDHYVFTYQESSKLLVSIQCLNEEIKLENSKCDAVKIFKKKNTIILPPGSTLGGKNPGAVVCKDALKLKISILKDSQNNENSFCVFNDGSMISAVSLQTLLKE